MTFFTDFYSLLKFCFHLFFSSFFLEYINHTFRVSWLFKVDNLIGSLDNLHVVVNISVRITSEAHSSHTHRSVLCWKHEVVSSIALVLDRCTTLVEL